MKQRLLTLALLTSLSGLLYAQCTTDQLEANDWVYNVNHEEAQEWVPACSGTFEEAQFWPHADWTAGSTATFYLQDMATCDILWTVSNISVTAGSISTVFLIDGSGTSREVVGGTAYRLAFKADMAGGESKLKVHVNNPYSSGTFRLSSVDWCSIGFPNWDLWFRASVDEPLVPLPVELTYFEAQPNENNEQVDLRWETSSEIDNMGFEIQRSNDAVNWKIIDFISGNGTTEIIQNYSYADRTPFIGSNYYRLKQIDYDGQYEFSPVRQAHFNKKPNEFLTIFPNPTANVFTVAVLNPDRAPALVKIFSSTGQTVWQRRFKTGEMDEHWKKEFDLPQEEMYFIMTQIGDQTQTQKVLVINNH